MGQAGVREEEPGRNGRRRRTRRRTRRRRRRGAKVKKEDTERCREKRPVTRSNCDILIMGATKRQGRSIRDSRGKRKRKRRRGANTVVASSSIPFALSVPVLNSSQASLQPFGLRLTVRSLSFFLAFSL